MNRWRWLLAAIAGASIATTGIVRSQSPADRYRDTLSTYCAGCHSERLKTPATQSGVILDNVDLSAIALRIMQGSAVIEANEIDKESPSKVGIGNLKVEIVKDGIYLFTDGKVVVVDGKVRDASNGLFYGKGYQIADDDHGYRAQKVKTFTTALELWSQKRDELIAQANLNVSNSLRRTPNLPLNSFLDVWLWYPAYGAFIYMPGARYRSPYGYLYRSVGEFFGGSGVDA